MKLTLRIFTLLLFTINVQAQVIKTDLGLYNELTKLETEYLSNQEDPKGVEILKNYNLKLEALKNTYNANGLSLDLANIQKKEIKSKPEIKLIFKNYRKALKVKINHFKTIDSFKNLLKKTYPDSVK